METVTCNLLEQSENPDISSGKPVLYYVAFAGIVPPQCVAHHDCYAGDGKNHIRNYISARYHLGGEKSEENRRHRYIILFGFVQSIFIKRNLNTTECPAALPVVLFVPGVQIKFVYYENQHLNNGYGSV